MTWGSGGNRTRFSRIVLCWIPLPCLYPRGTLSFVAARVAPVGTAPMAPLGGQQQMKGTCRYAEPPPYNTFPSLYK